MSSLRLTYNSSVGDAEPPGSESENIQLRPLISNSAFHNEAKLEAGGQDGKCLFNDPWWWYLEIGATCLSIISATLLIVLLYVANDKSMDSWELPLQPNTLIAIFTTALKSSIMLAAAACMSQLKWRHFTLRPRPLQHLQLYDDASRGPWGSVKLLFQLRTGAFTAYLLALITLAGLAIEPSAQQVLEFPSRLKAQDNVSATIGEATGLDTEIQYSNSPASDLKVSQDYLKAASRILGAIGDRVSDPYFDCPTPAAECFWPEVNTLAVCSKYSVTKASILMECRWDWPGREYWYLCEYNPMAFENGTGPISVQWNLQEPAEYGRSNLTGPVENPSPAVMTAMWAQLESDRRPELLGSEFMNMIAVRPSGTWEWTESNFTDAEVSMITWYWCEHTFENVTANGQKLNSRLRSSRPLSASDSPDVGEYSLHSDTSGRQYRVTFNATIALQNPLSGFFWAPGTDGSPLVMDSLSALDIEAVTESITAELSSQLRSQTNTNLTLLEGVALSPQVYIRVRWIWIVLPVVEVILSAVALLLTCRFSKGHSLLKSSSLALLGARLEVGPQGTSDEASSRGREEDTQRLSKARLHLHDGLDGRLEFVERK